MGAFLRRVLLWAIGTLGNRPSIQQRAVRADAHGPAYKSRPGIVVQPEPRVQLIAKPLRIFDGIVRLNRLELKSKVS